MTLLVKTGKKTEHLSQVGGVQTGGGRGRQEGDATTASFTETTPPTEICPRARDGEKKAGSAELLPTSNGRSRSAHYRAEARGVEQELEPGAPRK